MKMIWCCLFYIFSSLGMHNLSELNEQLKMQISQQEIAWSNVRDLIGKGAYVDTVTDNGETALILAVKDSNLEMVSHLLRNGADGDYNNKNDGIALRLAVIKASLPIMNVLVSAGLDLDIKDSKHNTALMWAVIIGDVQIRKEIVKLLLDSGADRTVTDDQNNTAMTVASDDQEITDLLVKKFKIS